MRTQRDVAAIFFANLLASAELTWKLTPAQPLAFKPENSTTRRSKMAHRWKTVLM